MPQWIDACAADEIAREDLKRFDHEGRTFAIYHGTDGKFYCTDGLCSHEAVHLSEGFVMDNIIECPKHLGQFDYRTGEAVRARLHRPPELSGQGREWPRLDRDLITPSQTFNLAAYAEIPLRDKPMEWRLRR